VIESRLRLPEIAKIGPKTCAAGSIYWSSFSIFLPAGEEHVPAGAEGVRVLAVRLSRLGVLDEAVERVSGVGHLLGPVGATVTPSRARLAPRPAVGLACASSGGQ